MSEAIRSLNFEHFRGLPDNEFKLKGKSLVLLGSNGKGKSAIIDGIEYLFAGKVSRFVGTGTGGIDHDDAIRHVKRRGIPKVTLSFSPSNGTVSRSLNSAAQPVTDHVAVRDYLNQHPDAGAFILRRTGILDFICDQDADRYKKFVQLLGVLYIDSLQRAFVEAEKQATEAKSRARSEHGTKIAIFKDPGSGASPQTLAEIMARVSADVEGLGLEKVIQWPDVADRLSRLKERRPEANKEKIDALTRALVSLETPLPNDTASDIERSNSLRERIVDLASSSVDASRSEIISDACAYLSTHQTETDCPLCEQKFASPLEGVIARLEERREALTQLRDAVADRQAALGRIRKYAEAVAALLKNDLAHAELLDPASIKSLRISCAATQWWLRSLKRVENGVLNGDVALPKAIATLSTIRKDCVGALVARKAALTPPDSSILEAAITLLERGVAAHTNIAEAEHAVTRADKIAQRASAARAAFSKAREDAIQNIFDQIAETVLDYYCRLHDVGDPSERSECTELDLKATSRAAAGGLKLAITFLGLAESRDPRAFLSEGHLDSLGLCVFLATVRIFNPPGTLLVLDDVLTSIDREHRRRVGELIFQEFSAYQVVLTTHDEHWHELLHSSARAWGVQEKWTFLKIEGWTVDDGPVVSIVDSSWSFVDAHLTELEYRELGGPFRRIFEDFCKRTAAKLELKVRFNIAGRYTGGDFVAAGIQDTIRDALVKSTPLEEVSIRTDVARVFGQGDLINSLSHDNPDRLEVTLDQAKDFVRGLRDLTKRCQDHKLIKER